MKISFCSGSHQGEQFRNRNFNVLHFLKAIWRASLSATAQITRNLEMIDFVFEYKTLVAFMPPPHAQLEHTNCAIDMFVAIIS